MRVLAALVLALALAAVAAAGCKERNLSYCGDTGCDAGRDASAGDGGGDAADVRPGCASDNDCRNDPAGPACDIPNHACVPCTGDNHCRADGGSAVCDTTLRACVACRDRAQCGGTKPVCDVSAAPVCRACQTDAECGDPRVCLADGHCATADEVIFVQNGAGCPTNTRSGTAQSPYCAARDAMGALRPGRSTVLITGPTAVGAWSLTAPVSGVDVVTVVGRSQATIAGGGDPAVRVSGGVRIVLRDLTFEGSVFAGIAADGGADLTVTRCVVRNNGQGGILVMGARFDITNTIIVNNMAGAVGPSGFGGAYLDARNASPQSRFANNTIAGNMSTAIACAEAYPIAASIVVPTAGQIAVAGCMPLAACCGPGDPRLDPTTFKLQAGSACADRLDPIVSLPLDIDVEARPRNGLSDCGADEY